MRSRRRFKVILALLFIACLTVFVEERMEELIPQLKSLAEAKVVDALGGKISFSIGSIDGGITHPIVLNDIRIKERRDSRFAQDLVIDNIRTSYYIKDVLLAVSGLGLPPLLNENSRASVNFSIKGGDITGFAGLYGDLSNLRFDGYAVLFGTERISFIGRFNSDGLYIEIRPDKSGGGSVRVNGRSSSEAIVIIDIKLDHLKVAGLDIAGDIVVRNKFEKAQDQIVFDHIEGEAEAKNIILNFKPFVDIKANYTIGRDYVRLTGFNLGEMFKAYGNISLRNSRELDLTLLANNVSLSWLMLTLGNREAVSVLNGILNGKFEFKGPLKKVHMSSMMEIKGGSIGKLDFDYMTAALKGDLPFLRIEDCRITRNSGYFSLAGELDLTRAGRDNMFDDIKLVTDDTAIAWDEWNSTQGKDVREVNMKKNIGAQFGFGYKKFVTEDKVGESLKSPDEVHLNYNLQANDSLKVMVGQNKDFFGFEHKDKF